MRLLIRDGSVFNVSLSRPACSASSLVSRSSLSSYHSNFVPCSNRRGILELVRRFDISDLYCRREALRMHMGRMSVEVRSIRWAHASLPEAYRIPTVSLRDLRASIQPIRPSHAAHEEAWAVLNKLLEGVLQLSSFQKVESLRLESTTHRNRGVTHGCIFKVHCIFITSF